MNERNQHKRVLEDVSHFFLSGDPVSRDMDTPSEEDVHEMQSINTEDIAEGPRQEDHHAKEEPKALLLAQPCDTAQPSLAEIVKTAENYLRSIHPGHFSAVNTVPRSRFGSAHLMLRNRRRYHILCGMVQGNTPFSEFVSASLGYFTWLKEGLATSRVFLRKSPQIFSYLFCKNIPSEGCPIVERYKGSLPICLVQYHVLRIPGQTTPILYFQTASPAKDAHTEEAPLGNGLDFTEDEWQRFNRLKEHALDEQ